MFFSSSGVRPSTVTSTPRLRWWAIQTPLSKRNCTSCSTYPGKLSGVTQLVWMSNAASRPSGWRRRSAAGPSPRSGRRPGPTSPRWPVAVIRGELPGRAEGEVDQLDVMDGDVGRRVAAGDPLGELAAADRLRLQERAVAVVDVLAGRRRRRGCGASCGPGRRACGRRPWPARPSRRPSASSSSSS